MTDTTMNAQPSETDSGNNVSRGTLVAGVIYVALVAASVVAPAG